MFKTVVIFLLSIVLVVDSVRIGGNPKTWSPVQEKSELDCTTCKVLIATLETDACIKCQDTKCLDFFEKYGDPSQVCQRLGVCPIK